MSTSACTTSGITCSNPWQNMTTPVSATPCIHRGLVSAAPQAVGLLLPGTLMAHVVHSPLLAAGSRSQTSSAGTSDPSSRGLFEACALIKQPNICGRLACLAGVICRSNMYAGMRHANRCVPFRWCRPLGRSRLHLTSLITVKHCRT